MPGCYFVLEGGDATGKSLHAVRLVAWLEGLGHVVTHLREPGSTTTGEALRRLLLDPASGDLEPLTEALLFSAARAEMLHEQVLPALEASAIVLVERCYLSTMVYQGLARGGAVTQDVLRQVTDAVHGDHWPDRIFLLDVDDATRRARADGAGKVDRIEAREESFHRAVRQSYLDLAAADPRVAVIDGRPDADSVQAALQGRVQALLAEVSA
jgi:dTMP kinase